MEGAVAHPVEDRPVDESLGLGQAFRHRTLGHRAQYRCREGF
ncbi:hypothetical protein ACFFX0_27835 [Citricoccus parietis]|uniref:Uncharacterized protein n=1 Tax=Citricoccus parietis TaxID=592307 RepID=A0ABV5G770_9MICC